MRREGQTRLQVVPCTFERANRYVARFHRHNPALQNAKFALAVIDDENVVHGVAIVTHPHARFIDDGWTVEVSRVCTDGHPNACSILYAGCAKVAKAMGFRKIFTYTLPEESGASMRATGWKHEGSAGGSGWVRSVKLKDGSRRRIATKNEALGTLPPGEKYRWSLTFFAHDPPTLTWPKDEVEGQQRLPVNGEEVVPLSVTEVDNVSGFGI